MTARAKGKVDLDTTRAQLEVVGLVHAAERLGELLEDAVKPIFNSFPVLREQRSPSTLAILVPEAAIGRDPGAKTL